MKPFFLEFRTDQSLLIEWNKQIQGFPFFLKHHHRGALYWNTFSLNARDKMRLLDHIYAAYVLNIRNSVINEDDCIQEFLYTTTSKPIQIRKCITHYDFRDLQIKQNNLKNEVQHLHKRRPRCNVASSSSPVQTLRVERGRKDGGGTWVCSGLTMPARSPAYLLPTASRSAKRRTQV